MEVDLNYLKIIIKNWNVFKINFQVLKKGVVQKVTNFFYRKIYFKAEMKKEIIEVLVVVIYFERRTKKVMILNVNLVDLKAILNRNILVENLC